MALTGRKVIYTDVREITDDNVLEVLNKAISVHINNRSDIEYLYKYYKGDQPVLSRTKKYRDDICNKIVENRANKIVSFKTGYLMGEPVQYINRSTKGERQTDDIIALNDFMFAEDKAAKDKELADWFHICGTAYRLILPVNDREANAPFRIYTLDPRNTFVVYYSGVGHEPVMGVTYVVRDDMTTVYSVYTRNRFYEIPVGGPGGVIPAEPLSEFPGEVRRDTFYYGDIPIVEYPANDARLGAFEIVLPLLDAINTVTSNRVDGVEQFVQAILALKGMDLEDGVFQKLKELGGLKLPPDGDAKYISQELNQSQTQTLVDYMEQQVILICGMPNRNGGSSTSDTGSAVVLRDGWSDAETRAKDTELTFCLSEKRFLAIAIRFVNNFRDLNVRLADVGIKFTRRNYENILAKAQVLTTLLGSGKVHPRLAFEISGLWADPDLAYMVSEEYVNAQESKTAKELEEAAKTATENAALNADV